MGQPRDVWSCQKKSRLSWHHSEEARSIHGLCRPWASALWWTYMGITIETRTLQTSGWSRKIDTHRWNYCALLTLLCKLCTIRYCAETCSQIPHIITGVLPVREMVPGEIILAEQLRAAGPVGWFHLETWLKQTQKDLWVNAAGHTNDSPHWEMFGFPKSKNTFFYKALNRTLHINRRSFNPLIPHIGLMKYTIHPWTVLILIGSWLAPAYLYE